MCILHNFEKKVKFTNPLVLKATENLTFYYQKSKINLQNNPGLLTIKQSIKCASNRLYGKEGTHFVDFEFVCGEYKQSLGKIFFTRDEKNLGKKIHNYLKDYYDKRSLTEIADDVYYYWGGEVGIKCAGWQKVKSFEELVSKLV